MEEGNINQEPAAKPMMSLDYCKKFLMVVRDFPPGCGSGARLQPAEVGADSSTQPKEAAVVGSKKPITNAGNALEKRQSIRVEQENNKVDRPGMVKSVVPRMMDRPRKTQLISLGATSSGVRDFPPGCGSGARLQPAEVGADSSTQPKEAAVVGSKKPITNAGNALEKRQSIRVEQENSKVDRPGMVKSVVPRMMDRPRKTQLISLGGTSSGVRDFPPGCGSGARLQPAEVGADSSTQPKEAAVVGSKKPITNAGNALEKRQSIRVEQENSKVDRPGMVKSVVPRMMDRPRKTQLISLGGTSSGVRDFPPGCGSGARLQPAEVGADSSTQPKEAAVVGSKKPITNAGNALEKRQSIRVEQENSKVDRPGMVKSVVPRMMDRPRKTQLISLGGTSSGVRDFPPGCGSGARLQPAEVGADSSTQPKEAAVVGSKKPITNAGNALEKRQSIRVEQENSKVDRPGMVKSVVPRMMDRPRKTQLISLGGTSSGVRSRGPEMPGPRHGGATAQDQVQECLRMFRDICKNQAEENKKLCREGKEPVRRVDLHAYRQLKQQGQLVNVNPHIPGHVPGVNIGDTFYYRMELFAVGVHRQVQNGIDFIPYMGQTVATSVVASRSGWDDMSNPNELVYVGEGGSRGRDKYEDQQLTGGNLALKNSIRTKTPVRVIRKVAATLRDMELVTRVPEVFIYDGLYIVEKVEEDHRLMNKVYRYTLKRVEGQPPIRRS